MSCECQNLCEYMRVCVWIKIGTRAPTQAEEKLVQQLRKQLEEVHAASSAAAERAYSGALVCVCTCVVTYMYAYTYLCKYIYIYVYTCIYIHIHVYVY